MSRFKPRDRGITRRIGNVAKKTANVTGFTSVKGNIGKNLKALDKPNQDTVNYAFGVLKPQIYEELKSEELGCDIINAFKSDDGLTKLSKTANNILNQKTFAHSKTNVAVQKLYFEYVAVTAFNFLIQKLKDDPECDDDFKASEFYNFRVMLNEKIADFNLKNATENQKTEMLCFYLKRISDYIQDAICNEFKKNNLDETDENNKQNNSNNENVICEKDFLSTIEKREGTDGIVDEKDFLSTIEKQEGNDGNVDEKDLPSIKKRDGADGNVDDIFSNDWLLRRIMYGFLEYNNAFHPKQPPPQRRTKKTLKKKQIVLPSSNNPSTQKKGIKPRPPVASKPIRPLASAPVPTSYGSVANAQLYNENDSLKRQLEQCQRQCPSSSTVPIPIVSPQSTAVAQSQAEDPVQKFKTELVKRIIAEIVATKDPLDEDKIKTIVKAEFDKLFCSIKNVLSDGQELTEDVIQKFNAFIARKFKPQYELNCKTPDEYIRYDDLAIISAKYYLKHPEPVIWTSDLFRLDAITSDDRVDEVIAAVNRFATEHKEAKDQYELLKEWIDSINELTTALLSNKSKPNIINAYYKVFLVAVNAAKKNTVLFGKFKNAILEDVFINEPISNGLKIDDIFETTNLVKLSDNTTLTKQEAIEKVKKLVMNQDVKLFTAIFENKKQVLEINLPKIMTILTKLQTETIISPNPETTTRLENIIKTHIKSNCDDLILQAGKSTGGKRRSPKKSAKRFRPIRQRSRQMNKKRSMKK